MLTAHIDNNSVIQSIHLTSPFKVAVLYSINKDILKEKNHAVCSRNTSADLTERSESSSLEVRRRIREAVRRSRHPLLNFGDFNQLTTICTAGR